MTESLDPRYQTAFPSNAEKIMSANEEIKRTAQLEIRKLDDEISRLVDLLRRIRSSPPICTLVSVDDPVERAEYWQREIDKTLRDYL